MLLSEFSVLRCCRITETLDWLPQDDADCSNRQGAGHVYGKKLAVSMQSYTVLLSYMLLCCKHLLKSSPETSFVYHHILLSFLPSLRQNLREKHSRHVADLRAYYESEIQTLRDKLNLRDLPQDIEKANQALTKRCALFMYIQYTHL